MVEVINAKVRQIDMVAGVTNSQVRSIKEQQSIMNEKLDSHSASLVEIEKRIQP